MSRTRRARAERLADLTERARRRHARRAKAWVVAADKPYDPWRDRTNRQRAATLRTLTIQAHLGAATIARAAYLEAHDA